MRSRTRVAVALTLTALTTLAVLLATHAPDRGHHARPPRAAPSRPASSTAPSPSRSSSQAGGTLPAPLPADRSPDSYAANLAAALWNLDYTTRSRAQAERFWRSQLADVVPAGAPPGTTVAQTQQAALSTLQTRLPTAATWASLAADHTRSSFQVTAVTEPAGWIAAVADGQITDPGLTARTVLGVQTVTYGTPTRTSRQSQTITIVMLCPPTTAACRLEIIPPDNGTTGP